MVFKCESVEASDDPELLLSSSAYGFFGSAGGPRFYTKYSLTNAISSLT